MYHSSCTTRACCVQLTSSPAHFFISPEPFPDPPFLSSIHHALYHVPCMLCLTRLRTCTCAHTYYPCSLIPSPSLTSNVFCRLVGFGNRNSDRDDPLCPGEGEVCRCPKCDIRLH